MSMHIIVATYQAVDCGNDCCMARCR